MLCHLIFMIRLQVVHVDLGRSHRTALWGATSKPEEALRCSINLVAFLLQARNRRQVDIEAQQRILHGTEALMG
jgi:hypothetical protein